MTLFNTYDEQLCTWLVGEPLHHGERGSQVSRCVPDFSCCRAELLSPPEVRARYVEGSPEVRKRMCATFMQKAVLSRVDIPGIRREGE
jgi:hypothetical protein